MTCQSIPPPQNKRFARRLKVFGFLLVFAAQISTSRPGPDPFGFFEPSITITGSERSQLDGGQPIARVLEATGPEVAVLAAVPVSVDGDRLVAWEQRIEELKKNRYVLAIGRFSDPPRIEDLANLELDDHDVAAIRSCRPQHCELKLSADEMAQLQRAEGKGDAIQQAFRQMILDRVKQYLANGQLPPDQDHHQQVQPGSRFDSLLDHTPFLADHLPQFTEDLRNSPSKPQTGVETFLYWSKEHVARKAVISVTQLSILRSRDPGMPEALIVGRDIFSTHYVNASLSITALIRGAGRTNYLVYVNRTDVDVLHGMFGGMIRRSIQDHLKDSANVLEDLRKRLESGEPPPAGSNASAQKNS